jgi:hypothetical protein
MSSPLTSFFHQLMQVIDSVVGIEQPIGFVVGQAQSVAGVFAHP